MKLATVHKFGIIVSVFSLFMNTVSAQNLVPNPGFEKKNACPGPMSGINLTQDWFSPTNATPDYFNSCSVMPAITGVPLNSSGYQVAKDGDAYSGIIAYTTTSPFFAEYITTKLTDKLIGGLNYDISFNVSLAELKNYRLIAINKLGAYLSKEPPFATTSNLQLPYSIVNPANIFLSDTSSWALIKGKYKAKGDEEHITIGCFDDGTIDTQRVTNTGAANASYYYIDVVSVSVSCDTITNTQLITVCDESPVNLNLTVNHPDYMQNGIWNTNESGTSINVTKLGIYWYRSQYGCLTQTDTFYVVDVTDSIKTKNDTTVCEAQINNFKLSSIPDAKSYLWNTGSTEFEINATGVGIYWYKAVKNCTLYHKEYTVMVADSYIDTANLGEDISICKDEFNGITLGRLYDSSVAYYKWNTGDTGYSIVVKQPGNYILTISNKCAESTDSIMVAAADDCNDCLIFPTAFTPNKDGLNDFFKPVKACAVVNYNIRIYNRWGQVIFSSSDIRAGWNGFHGASFADMGTYHYLAEYTNVKSGKKVYQKGQIMLIR